LSNPWPISSAACPYDVNHASYSGLTEFHSNSLAKNSYVHATINGFHSSTVLKIKVIVQYCFVHKTKCYAGLSQQRQTCPKITYGTINLCS